MDVHSKDEQTWSTKLKRIGERSKRDKGTVFNNIGCVIDLDMLKATYHSLEENKASGLDKMTKEKYGTKLEENLKNLLLKIRRGTYKPQPTRLVEIPKEDGSTRPLAISCLEDKIVQKAVNTILSTIYEPIFLPCSYGFRPAQNCHDALKRLMAITHKHPNGAVVEIDIRKYFNSIPLKELNEILRKKITDNRFLHLLNKLITAPTMIDEKLVPNDRGCPQGSIVSPTLANIYLHHVIDEWFESIKITHITGGAELIRYADDMVFVFENLLQAEKFFRVLPKRLQKFGLDMHADKSSLISSGSLAAMRASRKGKRLGTYNFLGFTCYWGLARNQKWWRLKLKSRRDRFTAKLKGLKKYLWENLITSNTNYILKRVARVVQGWINYHGISDNDRRVKGFIYAAKHILFKWFRRRGDRKKMNWQRLNALLKQAGFPERWKTKSMFPNPNDAKA
ncbi:MAG: group II intron reverse transcriptase/maturase [Burkholderiales bacterium]|nr:MAG: group II intron reverse transcriptase/maturase [Burkholderiales bacterium]